tara:strand:- start:5229 stop:5393 length:165 start_codon:yes stop_codon:yes gene_type:complete
MRHQSFWRRLLRLRPKRQSFFESQHVMIAAVEREAKLSRQSPVTNPAANAENRQ